MSNELRLEVPGLPPSAGHYLNYRVVTPRRGKPFVQAYHTAEAKAWWETVKAVNAGRKLRGPSLEVFCIFYLPDRRRRDGDNFLKCSLDSLTRSGAIEDDSLIRDGHYHLRHDKTNPRTVIVVRTEQQQMFSKE